MSVLLHPGDCLEVIPRLVAEGVQVDSIVCDPPYGLEFMGREWDGADGFRRSLNGADVGRDSVFGRTSRTSPEYRTGWQSGGGFSKPGIGERQTAWPSFSATSPFGAANPTCGTCGGRARGKKKCVCPEPAWKPIGKRRNPENEGQPDDVTSTGARGHLNIFQEWCEAWGREAIKILRPGGYLLAFGGTRTYHRMVCGLEDAGFVIQDQIQWIYATGFPKHHSHLKPAHEPIVLAYKPGGKRTLQVDECRIGDQLRHNGAGSPTSLQRKSRVEFGYRHDDGIGPGSPAQTVAGRWPANVCHDGSDEVVACFPESAGQQGDVSGLEPSAVTKDVYGERARVPFNKRNGETSAERRYTEEGASDFAMLPGARRSDGGSAARFFFSAKAGAEDRFGSRHPCLPPGEAVLTDQGLRSIETIKIGDRALAHDGAFRDVIDHFASPCNAPLYRIGVAGTNLTTTATANHPFLIWRPKISGNRARETLAVGESGWATAAELQVGDYLLTPVSSRGRRDNGKSDDWWFAAGLWLAEGTVLTNGHGSSRYPQYTLAAHETALVDRLSRAFPKMGVYPKAGALSVVVFESGVVDEFIRLCGSGAKNKRISSDVFDECEAHRRAFLDGYLAGDGCTVRGKRRAKTASRDLAATLARLGESLGWRASFYEHDDTGSAPRFIAGREIKAGIYYAIYFDGETDAPEFGRLTGKQHRTRFIEAGPALGCQFYSLRRVKGIECDDYRGEVWNLTVRGAHSFQTIVGASHNTVKPVELMKWLVALVTPSGGTCLDPFAGSGTTGVAALAAGRNALLIEREPAYCDDIRARLAHYEGGGQHSMQAKNRNRKTDHGPLFADIAAD